MIYAIVAIDDKRGMADDNGIPWDLPADKKFFHDQVSDKTILMGYGTYVEFTKPMTNKISYVATSHKVTKPGFTAIADPHTFLKNAKEDIWVIGGAGLLATVWDEIETIYATRVKGDFKCTKFLPEFEGDFTRIDKQPTKKEDRIDFTFEIWQRK